LISSTPTLSRPTDRALEAEDGARHGRAEDGEVDQLLGVGADVAPTSSTTLSPRMVGQMAAMAGRSMSAMVRRQNFDIAISAPVLPAETQASASPFLTASMARHMEDFQRPRRSAWLGLSSMPTETSQWWKSRTFGDQRVASSTGRTRVLLSEDDEAGVGTAFGNHGQARNDGLRTVVTAHGVDGNTYHEMSSLVDRGCGQAGAGRK
jgi:hypothetical protein